MLPAPNAPLRAAILARNTPAAPLPVVWTVTVTYSLDGGATELAHTITGSARQAVIDAAIAFLDEAKANAEPGSSFHYMSAAMHREVVS